MVSNGQCQIFASHYSFQISITILIFTIRNYGKCGIYLWYTYNIYIIMLAVKIITLSPFDYNIQTLILYSCMCIVYTTYTKNKGEAWRC